MSTAVQLHSWLHSHDTSLFPRPVLSCINAAFRVQIRIVQHFSRSTRISSSRQRILQKNLPKFSKICQKNSEFFKFLKILSNFCENFAKILQNLAEICKICSREDDLLVDLEKRCKMRPWLQKSASIQPRTSPGKSDVSWLCSWLWVASRAVRSSSKHLWYRARQFEALYWSRLISRRIASMNILAAAFEAP